MGLFEELRPRDVSADEWECWMHEYGRSARNADAWEYNRWWVSKVKSDVLSKLIRPEAETKRRRLLGRWKTRGGLSLAHKRPDLSGSIGDFGGLFFETPFGSHREFVKEKGRKLARVGHTIIAWQTGRVSWKAGQIKCRGPGAASYNGASFYYGLATVHAMLEEAERKGDAVSLVVAPRTIERGMEEIRSEKLVSLPKDWTTRVYGPDLSIAYEMNFFDILPNRALAQPHASQGDDPVDLARRLERERIAAFDAERTPKELTHAPWAKKRAEELRKWFKNSPPLDERRDASDGAVSRALFFEHSTDYERMKDLLLSVSPKALDGGTEAPPAWPLAVAYEVFERHSKEVRGTVILVTSLSFPMELYKYAHYLREMDKHADVVVIDVGVLDLTPAFRNDFLMRNGQPVVKYVYVGDRIEEMTERVLRAVGGVLEGVPV